MAYKITTTNNNEILSGYNRVLFQNRSEIRGWALKEFRSKELVTLTHQFWIRVQTKSTVTGRSHKINDQSDFPSFWRSNAEPSVGVLVLALSLKGCEVLNHYSGGVLAEDNNPIRCKGHTTGRFPSEGPGMGRSSWAGSADCFPTSVHPDGFLQLSPDANLSLCIIKRRKSSLVNPL